MQDWERIRTEYVTTTVSYRELCKKYGVSLATLAKRGKKEQWAEKREQHINRAETKVLQAVENRKASSAGKIYDVSIKLLDKIAETAGTDGLCAKDLRSLTAALKDLREIQGIRTPEELEEQRARIEKLKREAAERESGQEIAVELGEVNKYAE